MAGGWRISNEEELAALRRARFEARTERTEDAWNRFAACVAHCEQLGLLDDVADFDIDLVEQEIAASRVEDSSPSTNAEDFVAAD
ncbi:MAG: hypothetical protein ABIP21_10500 [Acidimicrobiia bacterium]